MKQVGPASQIICDLTEPGRLDVYLTNTSKDKSRSYWQKACRKQYVLVNDKPQKPNYLLKTGDRIKILVPALAIPQTKPDISIIYEDEGVVAFDKPSGMLTHSKGEFNPEFTVADYMREHVEDSNDNRHGIVHRLDRGTSGVIICAKTPESKKYLQNQFSNRRVRKTYIAIIRGHLQHSEGRIEWPIERSPKKPQTFRVGPNGKPAQTHYKVMKENKSISQIQLTPLTGRTHQLRVHMKHLGHPILGDLLYGNDSDKREERLWLHALRLELTLPSGKSRQFIAPLPNSFTKRLADEV